MQKSTPWERPKPNNRVHTKLRPKAKASAKVAAKRAGRSYPNLVDNMHAAVAQKRSKKTS